HLDDFVGRLDGYVHGVSWSEVACRKAPCATVRLHLAVDLWYKAARFPANHRPFRPLALNAESLARSLELATSMHCLENTHAPSHGPGCCRSADSRIHGVRGGLTRYSGAIHVTRQYARSAEGRRPLRPPDPLLEP